MTKNLAIHGIATILCAFMCIVSVYGIIHNAWNHEEVGVATCVAFLLLFLLGAYNSYKLYDECNYGKKEQEERRAIDYDNLKENILFRVIEKTEDNHWRITNASAHPSNYFWCSRIVKGIPGDMVKVGCVFFKKGSEAYEIKATHSIIDDNQSDLCKNKAG